MARLTNKELSEKIAKMEKVNLDLFDKLSKDIIYVHKLFNRSLETDVCRLNDIVEIFKRVKTLESEMAGIKKEGEIKQINSTNKKARKRGRNNNEMRDFKKLLNNPEEIWKKLLND